MTGANIMYKPVFLDCLWIVAVYRKRVVATSYRSFDCY